MRTKKKILDELFELDIQSNGTRRTADKKNAIHLEILIDIRDRLDNICINMTDGDISGIFHK